MKKLTLIIFFSCSIQLLFSQEKSDSLKTSSTIIIKDDRVNTLNETYKSTFALKGYRVQIYSGNKRQPGNQIRSVFLRKHPKTKAHMEYDQPNYKVRVGDFKTKLEALKYKNMLVKEFPNCFIVNDEIDIDALVN